MKLELTQAEIKAAVADYVANTIGLDLKNNDLSIVFSATRYEGTIAKLETTPKAKEAAAALTVAAAPAAAVIPGYSDTADNTAVDAPAAAEPVVDPGTPEVAAAAEAESTLGNPVEEAATLVPTTDAAPVEAAAETVAEAAAEPEAEVAAEAAPAPAAEAPKKATLFGKPAGTTTA